MNFSNKFIILAVLFSPNTSLELYLILLLIIGWTVGHKEARFGQTALILILLYGSYLIFLQFLSGDFSVRDLTEIFRLLTFYSFFCFIVSQNSKAGDEADLFNFIAMCSVLIFSISLIQSLSPNSFLGSVLLNVYMSDGHLARSFIGANRASGVSTGPGQAGTLASFLFAVNLTYFYFFHSKKLILQVVALLSCFGIIVLAQSQTAFITICVVVIFSVRYVRHLTSIKILMFAALLTVSTAGIIWLASQINVRYLFSLFEHGLGRSSFQKRLEKWESFIADAVDEPFRWLLGHGKHYFGDASTAVDSDIVFLIGVYGPIASIVFGCFIIYQFYKSLKLQTSLGALIALTIITGTTLSIPTNFIFDTKLLGLMIVVLLTLWKISTNEKNCSTSTSK